MKYINIADTLSENLENEYFIKENQRLYKNITLLIISISLILGIVYKRILYLDKKAAYVAAFLY